MQTCNFGVTSLMFRRKQKHCCWAGIGHSGPPPVLPAKFVALRLPVEPGAPTAQASEEPPLSIEPTELTEDEQLRAQQGDNPQIYSSKASQRIMSLPCTVVRSANGQTASSTLSMLHCLEKTHLVYVSQPKYASLLRENASCPCHALSSGAQTASSASSTLSMLHCILIRAKLLT